MGKYLLWGIIILGALLAARIIAHRSASKSVAKNKSAAARATQSGATENMVRCAHCGIHLPQSDAVRIDGRIWCSQEHARLGWRDHA